MTIILDMPDQMAGVLPHIQASVILSRDVSRSIVWPRMVASSISAFLSLASSLEDMEDVLRRLVGSRLLSSVDLLRRFLSSLGPWLLLLLSDGLRRRRLGGLPLLELLLLLLVSRRPSRLWPFSEPIISSSGV
jgi:hypothetical protein